jgi:hypothetical protein
VRRGLRWIGCVLSVWAVSCADGGFSNPSGVCGTRTDGARPGLQAPADGDVWVPDCRNPLAREYWRVFTKDETTGHMIPRPDGAPELRPVCDDPQNALRGVVDRYDLCTAAYTQDQVDTINAMSISDALAVGHYLHTQLKFVAAEGGIGIAPSPIPSDVVDACALGGEPSIDLQAICESVRAGLADGGETVFLYTGPAAVELAARLNQLYGIP